MADWYRQKAWAEENQELFFEKLRRARKDGRAQYLKIQAAELIETGDCVLITAAEDLLKQIQRDYADNNLEKASVLHQLGDIHKSRGEIIIAIEYYKKAIDFEEIYPNVITQAYLDYSELIIKTKATQFFNEVELILIDKVPSLLFPVEKYMVYSLLSVISRHNNNLIEAKRFAMLAEQNANAITSGLQYHKDLGMVDTRDSLVDKFVKEGLN